MTNLTQYLRQAYRATQRDDQTWEFKVDDRDDGDVAPEFCSITLTTGAAPDQFTLKLYPSPTSDELLQLVEALDGEVVHPQSHTAHITLDLTIKQVTAIRNLAKEFKRITGPGKRYPNPNWIWICRRTTTSLNGFADHITEFRRAKRHGLLEIASEEEEDEGLFAIVCTDETR